MTVFSKNINNFRFFYPATISKKPAVAISACLNGKTVRYDARDKSLPTRALLSHYLDLSEQCPEVSAGMPVPRPAIQLVQAGDNLHAIGRDDPALNVTEALIKQRQQSFLALQSHNICGYIFKSKSPSCGVNSTPIFNQHAQQIATGNGLQADYFLKKMPRIVIVDETQLHTQAQCEQFIILCFLMNELQEAIDNNQLNQFSAHYHFLFSQIDKQAWQRICTLEKNKHYKQYHLVFKQEMEKLFLITP